MNRLLIPLLLLLSMVTFFFIQCTWAHRLPLWGVHLELLPPLLLYAAFTVSLPMALSFALLAAILYDSFSGGVFGASMLPYALSTALFCGVRPIFFRNRVLTQFVSGVVFAFIAIFLQWTLSGKFTVGGAYVLPRILRLSMWAGFLSIFYFALLDLFLFLIGWDASELKDD